MEFGQCFVSCVARLRCFSVGPMHHSLPKKKNATYSYIFCSRVCKICGYSHLIASFETNTAKAIYLQPRFEKCSYRVVMQPRFRCLQRCFIMQGLWLCLQNAAICPVDFLFFIFFILRFPIVAFIKNADIVLFVAICFNRGYDINKL